MQAINIDHLNMAVKDLDESVHWYKELFGFEVVESGTRSDSRWAIIRSGDASLCIYEYSQASSGHELDPTQGGLDHFSLRISDREAWEEALRKNGVPMEYGGKVDWPYSTAWYVRDPSGYKIEVALWHGNSPKFPARDAAHVAST